MMKKMIEKLYDAQDYDKELYFGIYGNGINISITIVPDIMEIGNWFKISDKKSNSYIIVSFSLDSDVMYDEYEDFYKFKSGDITIEIGEIN